MTQRDKIEGVTLAMEIVEFARTRTGSPQTFLAALQYLDQWRRLKEEPQPVNPGHMPQLHEV